MTFKDIISALLFCAAAPAAAQTIQLQQPIDCTLGEDCFIQQYVDHDPTKNAKDYRCAPLSYNNHKGTDFALRTLRQMRNGVNVVAAAPGTVVRLRNSIKDQLKTDANAESVAGRECGNGVVIEHSDGWETQYCHLKKGSIVVRKGQTVQAGAALGEVGLSGRTQFPHVHLSVRKNGKVVDPFDPDGVVQCNAPDKETLWKTPLNYQPGGMIYAGFADRVPDYKDVKSGRAAKGVLPLDAPALVVFGFGFGLQKGDQLRLVIKGPNGNITDHTTTIEKNKAQYFQAAGKRLNGESWPSGKYTGTALLIRDGQVISGQNGYVTLK
ncbi:M23 family metallopeptidase [Ascidiaceihabitans sp.]|uniref:M23 family metallopeptidase n=1 Tax=Ascidiaceihabitans sp. TaxID=1872644 RepID=UPI003298F4A1